MRLIDADAVIERIKENCDARCLYKDYKEPLRSKMCNCCDLGDARMYVEDAPTVDVERHGYWEFHAKSIKDVPTESCSECGGWSYGDNKAYCPCCGAKMDEEEKER